MRSERRIDTPHVSPPSASPITPPEPEAEAEERSSATFVASLTTRLRQYLQRNLPESGAVSDDDLVGQAILVAPTTVDRALMPANLLNTNPLATGNLHPTAGLADNVEEETEPLQEPEAAADTHERASAIAVPDDDSPALSLLDEVVQDGRPAETVPGPPPGEPQSQATLPPPPPDQPPPPHRAWPVNTLQGRNTGTRRSLAPHRPAEADRDMRRAGVGEAERDTNQPLQQ